MIKVATHTSLDLPAFLAELKQAVASGEVQFDPGTRAVYSTDASNYRQIPLGAVLPRNKDEVLQTFSICRKYGAPILMRGAGTSLAGQCCNVAVVLDTSKYLDQILAIDLENKTARVEPGVVLDELRKAVHSHNLTFGPDPATHNRCTFGGMIGNNACGVHSVMAGKTVDNVEELEIVTYDGLRMNVGKTSERELERIIREGGRRGEIYGKLKKIRDQYAGLIRSRFPRIPRRVSGYNLDQLLPENGFDVARALVGTEGTCVAILEAKVKLVFNPPSRALLVLGYPDFFCAGDAVKTILHYQPIGLEGMDEHFIRNMKKKGMHREEIAMLPEGKGWLLVEFGGATQEEATARARRLMGNLGKAQDPPEMSLFTDPVAQKRVWAVRESTFGASVFVPGEKDTYAGFEDSAVPPEKLGDYLRDLQKLFHKYEYDAVIYGHLGDGCIHSRISFDLRTDPGIKKYRTFLEEAADLVVRYGGSFSGEHGDGQTWGELLPKMFGPELVQAFREFKSAWDPEGKMNPGKVVDTYGADQNLRLKAYRTIPQLEMHFQFGEGNGNFARTTERCIGIGKCLKKDEGAMCPSFMATHEEKHSTRGRARLLHEMMRAEVIQGGWRDEHVKEALDLCLACKACKTECPVNVDMATYKAEFLSHYYQGRPRPLRAYLFGLIPWGLQIAGLAPQAANFLTQSPQISSWLKRIAGIAPERKIPRIARENFRKWFRKRLANSLPLFSERGGRGWGETRPIPPPSLPLQKPGGGTGTSEVLLWPDTFNNFFYPENLVAAVEVLEFLGYQVLLPPQTLCCGRPLYDFGMLDTAKQFLKKILRTLRPYLERKIPIVGLEPSCVAVFRDELLDLFPDNEEARSLSRQTYLLSEFLEIYCANNLPQISGKAVVHGHCHQKALMGMGSTERVLSKLGVDFEILDAGCCGMAGAFGFEKEHYSVSLEIARQRLIPAIQKCGQDTLILSDGFSCSEQILHLTGRSPLHLAQLLHQAISGGRKLRQIFTGR